MTILIPINYKNTALENLVKNGECIIGITGKKMVGKESNFNIRDIKRVLFRVGEERDAIKLFVDENKEILLSDVNFRYRHCFYPQMLYKYYINYLVNGKLDKKIPTMPKYAIKRFRQYGNKKTKFCEYMRSRCKKLLENPDSLLHDCDFLNKYAENDF